MTRSWRWRRDGGGDVSLDEIVERAKVAAREEVRQVGCCCASQIRVAGWMRRDDGTPGPLLLVGHEWWCPLPRSMETFGQFERFTGPCA